MKCSCADWFDNIGKVSAPAMLQAARNPHWTQYDGKVFVYCPWCGRELMNDDGSITRHADQP